MNDMSAVIVPKSDQINADDLISGPMTITIEEVRIKRGEEQPVDIYFAGSKKAYRPCKSMSRVLVHIWGPDAGKYLGRSLTLYRDPTVRFGKDQVGGIRISHMTDIPDERLDNGRVVMSLTATRAQRKPHVVKPLVVEQAPNTARQTAEQWADEHMAALGEIQTVEALEAHIGRGAKPMGKLQREKPELHVRVETAYAARRAELEQEGPATQQRGEAFTDDGGFGD